MRTCCPHCETVFRITPEQLRAKGGRVRCGSCQQLFNAFDCMLPEPADTREAGALAGVVLPVPSSPAALPGPDATLADKSFADEAPTLAVPELPAGDVGTAMPEEPPGLVDDGLPLIGPPVADVLADARQAGLIAARDMAETPAYNRWAAGTLAGHAGSGLGEPGGLPRWPFVLGALLLLGLLAAQVFEHYPTEIVWRLPAAREWYQALNVQVPLPRQPELVSIESSELQADKASGSLVLQASLRNKAAFVQDWPALELTLTDVQDQVLTRRVLAPEDYLPKVEAGGFAAQTDMTIRLWLDGQQLPAAGYRLYVFYP